MNTVTRKLVALAAAVLIVSSVAAAAPASAAPHRVPTHSHTHYRAASTIPTGSATVTSAVTCQADGTYTVLWSVDMYPNYYRLLFPSAWTPADSRINAGPFIRGYFVHSVTQYNIAGASISASIVLQFQSLVVPNAPVVPLPASIVLAGTCTPAP